MRSRKITYLIFLVIFCHAAKSQKTTVYGKVTDAGTGEILPFVNIAFQNSKVGTTSDLNGQYSISTYYATDTLIASFVGYLPLKMKVRKDQSQVINFPLVEGDISLEAVVIKYKGNPADIIFDRIIENKPANNREKFSAYEYDVYNKVEFDLNNISDEFKDKRYMKQFKFIFDYVDSSAEKPFLPMFMTESISHFVYRKNPRARKEFIKATKVSGVQENSISQFLGDMYQNVNIYDNQIELFEKSFVSPIANYGQRYYKYYLSDSGFIDNKWCYLIEFKPKHIQDPVFEGYFWVNDTTYAIKKFEAGFPKQVNINYVRNINMVQEFDQVDGDNWMMTKDYLLADLNLSNKAMGIYGRKTTTYRNFNINDPRDDVFFSGAENILVDRDAQQKSDDYWSKNRHIPLSQNEEELYQMVDSLKRVPAFKTLVNIVTLIFTGYKEVGNRIEFGPYYKIYSYNPIEGHRFRFGVRTSDKWSEKFEITTHLAYGTRDERFKYGAMGSFMLSQFPRQVLHVAYRSDLEQLGQSQNAFTEDNILSSFLRRTPRTKLTNVEEYKFSIEREWLRGFSMKVMGRTREMKPLGTLSYLRYDDNGAEVEQDYIKDADLSLLIHFAYRESFLFTGLQRYSLGSDYPSVDLLYSRGISGVEGSQFDYDIIRMSIRDKFRLGTFGFTDWKISGGKYFGAIPYPLLQLHPGNESWFYDDEAFNLMNYFEFASDEYVSVFATHHFEGLFLNRIPLLRRLKWREVITLRSAWGRIDREKHNDVLILPDNMYSLESKPYVEGSVGIENILKIFRVDLLQRLTQLDHPNIATFGVRVMLEIRF